MSYLYKYEYKNIRTEQTINDPSDYLYTEDILLLLLPYYHNVCMHHETRKKGLNSHLTILFFLSCMWPYVAVYVLVIKLPITLICTRTHTLLLYIVLFSSHLFISLAAPECRPKKPP